MTSSSLLAFFDRMLPLCFAASFFGFMMVLADTIAQVVNEFDTPNAVIGFREQAGH